MSTTVEETRCNICDADVECGQTGLCEDCEHVRPRPFTELSERAKDKARSDYTSGDYPGYDWWDNVYYNAVLLGNMLGIEIGTTAHAGRRPNTSYQTTNIYFSGFSSQGDGACFGANYRYAPDAVKHISQETVDEELLRIAKELSLMQITQRLHGLEYFSAVIVVSSGNSIRTEIRDWGVDEVGEPDEKKFQQLMQDFADWIYKCLADEYGYLFSDEYVDERLSENDCMFDESGAII